MGSAWIGTEQVSRQVQVIVDSILLITVDIPALSEVGFFSILLTD